MSKLESKIKVNTEIPEPGLYKIIYLNDDKTSAEFVMTSLIDFFDYTPAQAEQTTVDIHEQGSSVVAIMPYEIAEQKGVEVTVLARKEGYPLQIKLEPENI